MKYSIDLVMLVDDNEASNNLSQILIEDLGCANNIVAKQTAVEALEFIKDPEQDIPDLILLDINMPIMNGWEFIEEFQELSNSIHKQPVIIMVSTSLNPDDQKRADSIPIITDYIHKPLNSHLLEEIVNNFFKQNNAA